ncbi:hypothetical protein [Flavobacterium sp. ACAM 123]|jgi:hypothetical protein|uniref:hypothetical protein n=1 Tax=Flavobacterium sp. ACAM 123 TaxID=1189620 RepID=UPI00031A10B3|nr:hypothetical protein [Flavobacterium sp. ACAM 123]
MKKFKLLALGIVLFIAGSASAQVSVNVNIGSPPAWGPSGYAQTDYYYLPDVQAYYDIRASQFIYFGSGNWVRSRYLPQQYRNYDLYNGYKVVLNDYHGRSPYTYFKNHKAKYHKGYKGKYQKTIGHRNNNQKRYSSKGNQSNGNGKGNKDHANKGNGGKGHGNGKH